MPIRNEVQRNSLASRYALDAPNGVLFTADPGTAGNATTEVTATGSPAYARKAITGNWSTGTAASSAVTGTAAFDVPSGTTVTHIGVASSATHGAATIRDSFDSVDQAFASQGTYTVTFSYTQS